MAMSETMSGSGPNDWIHFYQQNFPGGQVLPSSVSEATTVTTTVSATSPPLGMLNSISSTPPQLSPEGRVSKPIRRRSRASRRTPTTLLNTDTTNFRAMVQQFTGSPSAPFAPTVSSASASGSGLSNLGFGLGSRPVHVNPSGLMVSPSGYHIQQQQLYHQQQQQQQQNQHYLYSSNSVTEGGNSTFVERLSDPRHANVTDHGGLLMDHGGRFFPNTTS